MGRLSAPDRDMLRSCYEQLRPVIDSHTGEFRPIRGEPHAGNFIMASTGLHLIDFETVCRGPIEWDLASLPTAAAAHFGGVDAELLDTLRTLNNIRVATWCTIIPAESMRSHQQHHINIVRSHLRR